VNININKNKYYYCLIIILYSLITAYSPPLQAGNNIFSTKAIKAIEQLINSDGENNFSTGDDDVAYIVGPLKIKDVTGDVYISTNGAKYMIDVTGDVNVNGTIYNNGSIFVSGGGGGGVWIEDATGDIYRLTGKVGINKTDPMYQFDVSGDGGFSGWIHGGYLDLLYDASIDGGLRIKGDATFDGGDITLANDGTIGIGGARWLFDNANSDISTVASVGIGKTTPDAKLDILGDAIVSGYFKVDSNTLFIDSTNDMIGIGTDDPNGVIHVKTTLPILKMQNTNETDSETDGDVKLQGIRAQSGGEVSVMGEICFSHDGTGDNSLGEIIFKVQDDNTADGLETALIIDSTGIISQIDFYAGIISFENDAGEVTAMDIPVTTNSIADKVNSYTFKIDGENILSIASDASGDGTTKNRRIEIENNTQMYFMGNARTRGLHQNIEIKTSNYKMEATDDYIVLNGATVLTLPLPSTVFWDYDTTGDSTVVWHIKNIAAGDVSVDAWTTGLTTIDDSSYDTLSQYQAITIVTDGIEYWKF